MAAHNKRDDSSSPPAFPSPSFSKRPSLDIAAVPSKTRLTMTSSRPGDHTPPPRCFEILPPLSDGGGATGDGGGGEGYGSGADAAGGGERAAVASFADSSDGGAAAGASSSSVMSIGRAAENDGVAKADVLTRSPFSVVHGGDDYDSDGSLSLVDLRVNVWSGAWSIDGEHGDASSFPIDEDDEEFDDGFDEEFGALGVAVDDCLFRPIDNWICHRCLGRRLYRGRRGRKRRRRVASAWAMSRVSVVTVAFLAALALAIFAFLDAYDAAEAAKHQTGGGEQGGDHGNDEDEHSEGASVDLMFHNGTTGELDDNWEHGSNSSAVAPNVTDSASNSTDEDDIDLLGEMNSTNISTPSPPSLDGKEKDTTNVPTLSTFSPPASQVEFRTTPLLDLAFDEKGAGDPPTPPSTLAEICSDMSVSSMDGYWKCGATCNRAECCFLPDWHPRYCASGMEGDVCKVYELACKNLERQQGNGGGMGDEGANAGGIAEKAQVDVNNEPTNTTEKLERDDVFDATEAPENGGT